jgi:glyoxylase-like metal-dependent hydrolase (beta-lactamase superfamily II)
MTTRIGAWSLAAVEAGDFGLDGGAMFGVVPRLLWQREHPPDEENRIDMTMRALLIRGEVEGRERVILVDTGAGSKLTPKLEAIYRIDASHHDLIGSLAAHGVTPSAVTDVILTHLHFDHAGGATRYEGRTRPGSGGEPGAKPVPTFPNALYHVQRRQWEWACAPSERDKASFFEENFLPLQEGGVLHLITGEVELYPNLFLMVVDGHTPAQQLPLIRTTNRTFLYCGDLFPTASHIHLPYIMSYDLEPLKSLAEKKRVLPQAVEEQWVLFFEHDARRECAQVEVAGDRYRASESFTLEDCD